MSYVYEPAEDSALLAQAAEDVVSDSDTVVDVGTGTGYVAQHVLNTTSARVCGIDINRAACEEASANGVQVLQGNVTNPLAPESVDVVLFNPPYLPAYDEEPRRERLAHGDGGAAIQSFLSDVGRVLRTGGTALLVMSTRTPLNVEQAAEARGLTVDVVASDSLPFETLRVLKLGVERKT